MSDEDFLYNTPASNETEDLKELLRDMYGYLYNAALLQDQQRSEDPDTYNKFNEVLMNNLEELSLKNFLA